MSALVGRKVFIRKGSGSPQILLAAGRNKAITVNATPIDITTDDDAGFRTLLEADAGLSSIDLTFDGITKNSQFLSDISAGNFVDDFEIEIEGVGAFNGRFFLASVAINAPYQEGTTFSTTFQSTGPFTFDNVDSP